MVGDFGEKGVYRGGERYRDGERQRTGITYRKKGKERETERRGRDIETKQGKQNRENKENNL